MFGLSTKELTRKDNYQMAIVKGDFRARLLKVALENVAEQLARKMGRSDIAHKAAGFVSQALGPLLAKGAINVAGVAGAALFQAPTNLPFIGNIFQSLGLDTALSQDILNEVYDASVIEFTQTMGEGADPTDDQIRNVVAKQTQAKLGDDDSVRLRLLQAKCLVREGTTADEKVMTVHSYMCPCCKPTRKETKNKGKKGEAESVSISIVFGNGVHEITVGFALENHYKPTNDPCCKETISRLFKAAKRRKMDLFECLGSFEGTDHDLFDVFYKLYQAAKKEEKERIAKVAQRKTWGDKQPLLEHWLRAAKPTVDSDPKKVTDSFVTFLEMIAAMEPKPAKTLQDKILGVLTGNISQDLRDKEAQVRETLGKWAVKAHESADRVDRQADMANLIIGRR